MKALIKKINRITKEESKFELNFENPSEELKPGAICHLLNNGVYIAMTIGNECNYIVQGRFYE